MPTARSRRSPRREQTAVPASTRSRWRAGIVGRRPIGWRGREARYSSLDPIAEEQARSGDAAALARTLGLYAVETDQPGYPLRRAYLVTGDMAALEATPDSAETIERARLLARAGLREEALALAERFKAEPSGITPFQLIELALELAHRPGARIST